MHIRRLLFVLLSILVLAGITSWASAAPSWKDKTEAKKLYNQGMRQQKQESWQEARESFEAAIALHDTSKAQYQLARALYKLGLLVEAREHAQVVADNQHAAWWDRKHSKEILKKINDRVAHITVTVPPDFEGTVHLGEMDLTSGSFDTPIEVNPGTIELEAEADGFLPFHKSVELSDGADEKVSITLEPEAAPEPEKDKEDVEVSTSDGSTRRTIGYVSLAVGGIGLIAGTVYGLKARGTRDDLSSTCPNDVCSERERDTFDQGKTQANIATAGFLVGGVGVGLGAVLLLTGQQDEPEADTALVRPYVGPMSAGVHGRF